MSDIEQKGGQFVEPEPGPGPTPPEMAEADEDSRRESGLPGGGKGRRDEIGPTGVYRVSDEQAPPDSVVRLMGEWGQGERGIEGFEDHGDSELFGLTAEQNLAIEPAETSDTTTINESKA